MDVFAIILNVVTIATLALGIVSFLVYSIYGMRPAHMQRTLNSIKIFSTTIIVITVLYAAIYIAGGSWFFRDLDSNAAGSLWLNVAAVVTSFMLIRATGENDAARHGETTTFSLMCYGTCLMSAAYVLHYTCLFGDIAIPAYYFSAIAIILFYLIYTFLTWKYVCKITGINNTLTGVLSKLFVPLLAISALLTLTSPYTGWAVQLAGEGDLGVNIPMDTFLLCISPTFLVGLCSVIVTIMGKIDLVEKIALIFLVVIVPGGTTATGSFLAPKLDSFSARGLLALLFCYVGILDRRAGVFANHIAQVEVAANIQQGMLPKRLPHEARFELAARMKPASEVAGDYYDFYRLDADRFYVVVADVSGQDIPTALFVVRARALIREHASQGLPPNEILNLVNGSLSEENAEGFSVTAWIAQVDLRTGTLSYCNAGHKPPVHVAGGEARLLSDVPDPALGVDGSARYSRRSVGLGRGDRVVLYTDGLTDFANAAGRPYGEEGLAAYAGRAGDLSAQDLVDGALEDAERFAAGAEQLDDIAVICLSYQGDLEGGEMR